LSDSRDTHSSAIAPFYGETYRRKAAEELLARSASDAAQSVSTKTPRVPTFGTLSRRDKVEFPDVPGLSTNRVDPFFHDSDRVLEELSIENTAPVSASVPDFVQVVVPRLVGDIRHF
jgi:hypothetical protein